VDDQEEATDFDHMVADVQRKISEREQALYLDKVVEGTHTIPRTWGVCLRDRARMVR